MISLDLTDSGVGAVVVCERHNYQGTETGPITLDTEILVAIRGLHITLTLDQLTEFATELAKGMRNLPEQRKALHAYWSRKRAAEVTA